MRRETHAVGVRLGRSVNRCCYTALTTRESPRMIAPYHGMFHESLQSWASLLSSAMAISVLASRDEPERARFTPCCFVTPIDCQHA